MLSERGQVSGVKDDVIGHVLADEWLDHGHEHAEQSDNKDFAID